MGEWMRGWELASLPFLMFMTCVFFALSIAGCARGQDTETRIEAAASMELSSSCSVTTARFPTTEAEFSQLYAGRGFYVDGNHLGRDLALAEGVAVHPIACGIVRAYRSAQGYGTLAVAIEHQLPRPLTFTNGLGEAVTVTRFLTVYGHLRPTTEANGGPRLPWVVGDVVTPEDVIGYVQTDALNGDGNHHLHLGVRLQSFEEASATDASWFRGYDAVPSQRRFFADPAEFLPLLRLYLQGSGGTSVRWHPPGTILRLTAGETGYYVVDADEALRAMSALDVAVERHEADVVPMTSEELRCLPVGPPYQSARTGVQLVKFADASAVYEVQEQPRRVRRAFVSLEAFHSWGYLEQEIQVLPASGRAALFVHYADAGLRRMRPGTLVNARGVPEVSVVTETVRLPFISWELFQAMGYRAERLVEVDPAALEANAGPRGTLLTPELVAICRHPGTCVTGCDAGTGGGTAEAPGPDVVQLSPSDPWDTGENTGSMDATALEAAFVEAGWSTPSQVADAATEVVAQDSPLPTSRGLAVRLAEARQASCPGGYVLTVWDDLGRAISSIPGDSLSVSNTAGWRGYAMLTAYCQGRPAEWGSPGLRATEAGVSVIRFGGRDLTEATRVCRDVYSAGIKLAIPLEPSLEGTCP